MTADLIAVADAVVAALNGHTFSAPYNAPLGSARYYVPVFNLAALATLKVSVVPQASNTTLATRQRLQEVEYRISVGITQAVPDMTPASCDPLSGLVQEVQDFLIQTPLVMTAGTLRPSTIALSNEPIYDPDKLEFESVFQSVLNVTYKGFR